MRATVVKHLRRQVYGKGHHPGPVWYAPMRGQKPGTVVRGVRVADPKRWEYQQAKREWKQCPRSERGKIKTGRQQLN